MDKTNREGIVDKIAILIINHETPEETQKLVDNINNYFIADNFDLTVVDNSVWYPMPNANIKNTRNRGFDQVVIDWLKENKSKEYLGYWTLNSDCIIKPQDYTESIINYLKDHKIGLLSTLIHEPRGWGDSSPLQNPQNIKSDHNTTIGYIDFQSAIISRGLLNVFKFDNDLVYFLWGLDIDFNLCCEKYNLLKVLIQDLELMHLGAQSYREPDGSLITMKLDEVVDDEEQEHIKRLHLNSFVKDGGQLMTYGIKKRYGLDLGSERQRMQGIPQEEYM
jgi:hypothetical protein